MYLYNASESVKVKRITKNPDVDTSFLPDREREVCHISLQLAFFSFSKICPGNMIFKLLYTAIHFTNQLLQANYSQLYVEGIYKIVLMQKRLFYLIIFMILV